MDLAPSARRAGRSGTSRKSRRFSPAGLEALEERALLALAMLQDINPATLLPAQITGAGGKVYFVTQAVDGRVDLDVETATGATALKAFHGSDSPISELTADGSKLFFVVSAASTEQLWETNGTPEGTRLVIKIRNNGYISDLTVAGNELYFTNLVSDGRKSTTELFQSDGTAAGTEQIALPAGTVSAIDGPHELVSFDDELFFASGSGLMKTSGRRAVVVENFAPAQSSPLDSGLVDNLTVAGGTLYFTYPDPSGEGEDLYASNGTAQGTSIVHEFENANPGTYPLSSFAAVGSQLYFGVDDPVLGPSLWSSNGTAAGTTLVKALGEAPASGANAAAISGPLITEATAAGGKLFFTTGSPAVGANGTELWVSDGTAAGTTMLTDINPGNAGLYSQGNQLAALGGTLFFSNDDRAHGVELWESNGTVAGTGLFMDLDPGPASSFPANMAVIDNTLYFSAAIADGSSALWSSNGTVAGTSVVASLPSQPQSSGVFYNIPEAFDVIGNTMVFAADDGTGTELWKTDGTSAGTEMIADIVPGTPTQPPSDFTAVDSKAFFVVTQGTTETLWVTDGTAAGTNEVATLDGTLADPLAFDGKLAFIETTDLGDSSLWVSNGTAGGTTQVMSFPSPGQNFGETPTMAALGGELYISAPAPPGAGFSGEFALYESDGTTAGTTIIAAAPENAYPSDLTVYQGKLYFSASSPGDIPRAQLWATNGTADGTKLVATLGGAVTFVDQILAAGPNLYVFVNDDSGTNRLPTSLYKSNGTAKGSVLLHYFPNNFPVSTGVLANGELAFTVGGKAPQLWLTNGTVAGTTVVKDIGGGEILGFGVGGGGVGSGAIAPIDGRFFIAAQNAKYGNALWQSNGTVAGTTLVQDFGTGEAATAPYAYALTELNGQLIVAANDGTHGLELWSGPIPAAQEGGKGARG
jgi:ELWxxDGT repeat protein